VAKALRDYSRGNPNLVVKGGILGTRVIAPADVVALADIQPREVLLARIAGLGGGIMFPMTAGLSLIGVLVEYLAWTVGFGAVALARFTRPSTVVPAAS